jgi:secreted trypsin-like serine protease
MILMLYLNSVFPIVVHTLDDTSREIKTPDDKENLNGDPRILGGKAASVGQFPYQVKLLLSN